MRLAQLVGRAVPVRRDSPRPERRGSQLQVLPADSQLEERRRARFVVAREIARMKSAQTRVNIHT